MRWQPQTWGAAPPPAPVPAPVPLPPPPQSLPKSHQPNSVSIKHSTNYLLFLSAYTEVLQAEGRPNKCMTLLQTLKIPLEVVLFTEKSDAAWEYFNF